MAEKPEIAPHLAKMLRQGRQYDLCFIGATQDMLVKTLGTSSGIRECFRTGYYTGGDMTTARVILDLQKGQTIDEDGLGVEGRVYLKTAMSLAQEVRVPFASSQSVYELLGQHLSPLTDEPAFEHDTHKTTQDLVRDVSLDVRPGEAACESVVSLTAEERLTILTAARAQMAATGKAKVNRSQLLTSQGWNNRMWPKVKQVLDEEGL